MTEMQLPALRPATMRDCKRALAAIATASRYIADSATHIARFAHDSEPFTDETLADSITYTIADDDSDYMPAASSIISFLIAELSSESDDMTRISLFFDCYDEMNRLSDIDITYDEQAFIALTPFADSYILQDASCSDFAI